MTDAVSATTSASVDDDLIEISVEANEVLGYASSRILEMSLSRLEFNWHLGGAPCKFYA